MYHELEARRSLMMAWGIVTISLVHAETTNRFNARNPFGAGGVYEAPATGAAAAAVAGYLRDLDWPHGGAIDVIQGEDMGMSSKPRAEFTSEPGASVRISGAARIIDFDQGATYGGAFESSVAWPYRYSKWKIRQY